MQTVKANIKYNPGHIKKVKEMWKLLNQSDRVNRSQVISILAGVTCSSYWVKNKPEIPRVIVSIHCDFSPL